MENVTVKNQDELLEIARVAKLSLSSEETDSIFSDIADMMGVVQIIKDVDLAEYDCSDEADITELREDVVIPSLPVDLILSNAEEKHDSFFTV
jgi:aspartyl/glutamyl-tRNA(Asn/Gln) amidotransferase C subunit